MRVLAVDPGRSKCGVAMCGPREVLAHRVVSTGELVDVARDWIRTYGADLVVIGNSTGAQSVARSLAVLPIPLVSVEERGTTLAARARYFQDRPPRGWRRLLPRSLLVPPEPYDDYAAIVLADGYFNAPDAARPFGGGTGRSR